MANEELGRGETPSQLSGEFQRIMDVRVDVSGRLGRCQMRLKEVLDLDVGTIVQLKQNAKEPIELCLNEKVVARGEVVVVNDSFGIKITEMVE
jgi:flagellar motor switch protein FliN/FliY